MEKRLLVAMYALMEEVIKGKISSEWTRQDQIKALAILNENFVLNHEIDFIFEGIEKHLVDRNQDVFIEKAKQMIIEIDKQNCLYFGLKNETKHLNFKPFAVEISLNLN